jgi:16S rRNA (cytidine1402-2'-O)-methyltransferase
MPGTLFVVATPIGNLEDITGRALRVLREVALIAAEDTRRTARLLARYAIPTPTTSLHEHNEFRKIPSLVARLGRGDHVALVSDAGTPTVSDPGQRFVAAALEAGIRVEPVPGPSAATAALAVSGFPAGTFTFLGFPPTKSKERARWFEELRTAGRTVVFCEAPHRVRSTLEQLLNVVGDRIIVVARELTKAHEQLVKRPISEVLKAFEKPVGEHTIVVEIGLTTYQPPAKEGFEPSKIGLSTETGSLTKRQRLALLAKQRDIRPNELYREVERAKKLVE